MRILFVSGTSIGGSAHSTRELADRLVEHGHHVAILFRVEDASRTRHIHKRAINLVVKLEPSPLARPVDAAAAVLARRPHRSAENVSYEVWQTQILENSLPRVLKTFGPGRRRREQHRPGRVEADPHDPRVVGHPERALHP